MLTIIYWNFHAQRQPRPFKALAIPATPPDHHRTEEVSYQTPPNSGSVFVTDRGEVNNGHRVRLEVRTGSGSLADQRGIPTWPGARFEVSRKWACIALDHF
jgi:hypothetical protein